MEEVVGSLVVRGLRTAAGIVAWSGDALLVGLEWLLDRKRKPKRGREK
ncbi:hypothetical protein [Streptomyces sp. MUM 203J]|nr:hypothetical protein [Streptomyces sp. MUM 203J]